jgi:DNA-binding XRE family transcriptional regulator
MRQTIKIPRIIKVESETDFVIRCMFNNGEDRLLDFESIFKQWKIGPDDVEFPLLELRNFEKFTLRNQTLSWPDIKIELPDETGALEMHPYEIGPDVLYRLSEPAPAETQNGFGTLIRDERKKAGLTQDELAQRSGTSRFYISRIENNRTDVEMSTLRKIVEAGLGRSMKLVIE